MFVPHLIKYGALKALTANYHNVLTDDEDIELASGYLATLKELKESYENSFLTKDILKPTAQQQERRRAR